MSSSNSPCAACKCLRRKCTQECVFAPYFPPDNPQKFTNVHKVFGASNVSKILNELNVNQREEAVISLAYEADYRLRDPVYGCVGLISMLQQRLKQVHLDLENAKKELATYIGPSAMLPILNHPAGGYVQQHSNYGPASAAAYQMMPYNAQQMMGLPTAIPHGAQLMIRDPQQQQHQQQQQQQQFLEVQQLAVEAQAAARHQEMMRNYELQQQQQQNDLLKFNGGFDDPVTATGFNQIAGGGVGMQQQPSLALGSSYEAIPYHQIQQQQQQEQSHLHPHHQLQHQIQEHQHQIQQHQQDLLLQQQQSIPINHHAPPHQQSQVLRAKSEEDERSIGPSC